MSFSVVAEIEVPEPVTTGEGAKLSGLDFGLQTFLTDHNGTAYRSPEFLKHELATRQGRIRQLHRNLSRKQRGLEKRRQAHTQLSRAYIRLADKRRDSHFKLAHELCDRFDIMARLDF